MSSYVRLRDATATTGTKEEAVCCTCGKRFPIIQMDAGHYSQAPHEATRFDERNVHAQCKGCNGFRQGEQVLYKDFLIKKYGKEVEKEIWNKRNELKRWTRSELDELHDYYKQKYKELKA